MNHLYEHLRHEWNYVCFLADHYGILPCASIMTQNMISEQYLREEEDNDASTFDSTSGEDKESGDNEVLIITSFSAV